ncbi:MAG TPA: dUTP diphosphatase [Methanosarcina sp.]|nr:dUTP diphosphatase [Methanosarcina sp.]
MRVKVKKLHENAKLPTYATNGSGCFDIYHCHEYGDYVGEQPIWDTGLVFEIPKNHVMLVFSRSGHGFKHDVRLANCVGVIDSDYRGEVKVKLKGDGDSYYIDEGERIAQGMIIPVEKVQFEEVYELSNTERGEGGFGSTGT